MARRKKTVLRYLRIPLIILAALVAIPIILTPVYLVVSPISVPMIERERNVSPTLARPRA